jgi:hypothetical protein
LAGTASDDAIEGYVDRLGRPVIWAKLPGLSDDCLCHIDTGCNVGLVISASVARDAGIAYEPDRIDSVALANRRVADFYKTRIAIEFLGQLRRVSIVIPTSGAESPAPPDAPAVLIGTELLADCRLEIDFRRRAVLVHRTA